MSSLKNYILPVLWIGVISMFSTEAFGDATTSGVLHHLFGFLGISPQYHELHKVDFLVRKSAHLTVYAVLAALWFRAFRKSGVRLPAALLFSLAISVSCGALDEFHQSFEPGRTSKVTDVFIDTTGAAISLFLITLKIKKRPVCGTP